MMTNKVVASFVSLGEKINTLSENDKQLLKSKVRTNNPWFVPDSVDRALEGIACFLDQEIIHAFLGKYSFEEGNKTIGIVMAGNIPAVGFHDLLMVLLSGNTAVVKLSSDDSVLIPFLMELMDETLLSRIKLIQKLVIDNLDAVIATGSNNTARYFETYFSRVPNIIRKSRTSCAILDGSETDEDFKNLGIDIVSYFGKGCRNVTKLFVPKGYSFQKILDELSVNYADIIHHSKYNNNYDYYKSIYLVNRVHHYDTGFMIFTRNEHFGAPISVVFYEEYEDLKQIEQKLETQQEAIQCVVGKGYVPFGRAQFPAIDDFADGIDTFRFLIELN